jgi:hypothetical protein
MSAGAFARRLAARLELLAATSQRHECRLEVEPFPGLWDGHPDGEPVGRATVTCSCSWKKKVAGDVRARTVRAAAQKLEREHLADVDARVAELRARLSELT